MPHGKQRRDLLEQLRFGRHVEVQTDVVWSQQLAEGIHWVRSVLFAGAAEACLWRRRFVQIVTFTRFVEVNDIRVLIEVDQLGVAAPRDQRLEQPCRLIVWQ